jgi:plastocyanin
MAVVAILLAPGALAADKDVSIENFAFTPFSVSVPVGDSVTWTNQDAAVTHTATANNGAFDTGQIKTGSSATVTFEKAGTFNYHCSVHPGMTGRVVVVKAATAVASGTKPKNLPRTDVALGAAGPGPDLRWAFGLAGVFVGASSVLMVATFGRKRD